MYLPISWEHNSRPDCLCLNHCLCVRWFGWHFSYSLLRSENSLEESLISVIPFCIYRLFYLSLWGVQVWCISSTSCGLIRLKDARRSQFDRDATLYSNGFYNCLLEFLMLASIQEKLRLSVLCWKQSRLAQGSVQNKRCCRLFAYIFVSFGEGSSLTFYIVRSTLVCTISAVSLSRQLLCAWMYQETYCIRC